MTSVAVSDPRAPVPGFYQATIDALPSNVAVIDPDGAIVAVNSAWRHFADRHGLNDAEYGIGRNYLALCEDFGTADGTTIARGLRDLLAEGPGPFRHEYECAELENACWVRLSALRLERPGSNVYVMIVHEDITARRQMERELRDIAAGLLLAEDAERRRIGRELHEGVAQQIAGAKLLLGRFTANDEGASGPLAEASNLLAAAIVELRTMSYLLHPPMLEPLGLVAALRQYAGGFSRRTGVAVALDIEPPFPRLSAAMEIALYRVAQEALDNLHRHSGSKHGELSLKVEGRAVRMTVRDHGVGLPEREDCGGAGLQGMKLRLQQLGGAFRLADADPGLLVVAELPAPSALFHTAP